MEEDLGMATTVYPIRVSHPGQGIVIAEHVPERYSDGGSWGIGKQRREPGRG